MQEPTDVMSMPEGVDVGDGAPPSSDGGEGPRGSDSAPEAPAEGGGDEPPQDGDQQDGDQQDGDQPATDRRGPGEALTDEELLRQLAALLFASPDPLSLGRLTELLERPARPRVRAALETLGQRLQAAGLPIEVRGLKGGYTLMSTPELGDVIGRLARGGVERISPAALETLAVVAYRQPVTKAEIEAIRGVQAGPVLRSLVDRGLVRVVGRADVPGHPLQYGTTKEFLDRFGLMEVGELPRDAELSRE